MYKETVVVAFHKPSSGRRRKTIHSISNSIAYRPWRGSIKNYDFIIYNARIKKMTEIAGKIFDIVKKNAKYESDITMDTMLVEDMGFTSIGLVEVVYDIEREFNITLELYELEYDKINLIGNLVGLVERKVSDI